MRPEVLTAEQISSELLELPDWELREEKLRTTVSAPSFLEAIDFVRALAVLAEEMDHHPDIDIRWRSVHIGLATHDPNGITELDVKQAHWINDNRPTKS